MSPCPYCRHQNARFAQFCGNCGQSLLVSTKLRIPLIGLLAIGILLGSGLLLGIERLITGDWLFPSRSALPSTIVALASPITFPTPSTAMPTNQPAVTSTPVASSTPITFPTPSPPTVTPLTLPSPTPIWQYAEGLIAYACDGRIYLYDPVGGNEWLLPNQPRNSVVPAFSPLSLLPPLLTYRSNASGTWQIYVSPLDGDYHEQITSNVAYNNYEAVWSPDGQHLAFVSDRGGNKQIFVMDSSGRNQTQLTFNNTYNDDPTWSSTNTIAFESDMSGRFSIYTIAPDGSRLQRLVSLGSSSSTPAWSYDGMWLAFEVRQGENRHIWMTDNGGNQAQQITTLGSENQRPAWSPDGTRLVFHSNYDQARSNRFDIWLIELSTGEMRRLTWHGDCFNPAWSKFTP